MMPLIAAINMFFRLNPSAEVSNPTLSHTQRRASNASPAIRVGFISNAKLTFFFEIMPIFFSNFAILFKEIYDFLPNYPRDMPKYNNYSPEIPQLDDSPEIIETKDTKPSETSATPVTRRRRGRNSATSRGQDSMRSASGVNSGQKTEENKTPSSGFRQIAADFKSFFTSYATRIVVGIVLGGLGFWFAVAFVSYLSNCIADQSLVSNAPVGEAPNVANDAGEGGARIMEILINQGFGIGSFVLVVWLICMSLKLLVGYPRFRSLDFTIKCLVAFITLSVVTGMLSLGLDTPVNWGGFHGRLINEKIYEFVGWSGALILSVVLVAIFVVICLRDFIKWILKKKHEFDEKLRIRREALEAEARKEEEIRRMRERESRDQALSGEGAEISTEAPEEEVKEEKVLFNPDSDILLDISDLEEEPASSETTAKPDDLDISEEPDIDSPVSEPSDNSDNSDNSEHSEISDNSDYSNSSDNSDHSDHSEISESPEPSDVMTVNVNQIEKGDAKSAPTYDTNLFTHSYNFPPYDFLRPGTDRISVDADEQLENKEKIRKTLLDFGIPITSIEATVGPTVTLYEIKPENGVKIVKIKNLVDDIALSLAAIGVRIIAPIPGKGTVGIEVANKDPQTVSMRTIIQSKAYQDAKYKLPVAMGSTISNDVYIADLSKMPHLLVAGATGQGKSVGLNAIITSLLYSKRPEELKFVLVDPKRVEFSLYSKIENYYLAKIPDSPQPIITNMENVVATLSSLCVEMDERYQLLEKAFVRQVSEYNEKFKAKKLDPREGHRFMPYIVVVIDEFADLIMTAGKEVEQPIARLAQLARAVGIHVIVATQRPSTNVITGMIKANFPVRIAFKVASGVDSKTILDSTGAQQLIGRGDMLISNNGEMTRVQCAFVDTPEVEEICDYISRQPYPQGPYILPEPQVNGGGDVSESSEPLSSIKRDPLFEEVAREVVISGMASTSAVQRRHEIGFTRAGRIMDQLEAYGIVGPATGGKPRNVLVDMMGLDNILSSI